MWTLKHFIVYSVVLKGSFANSAANICTLIFLLLFFFAFDNYYFVFDDSD